MTLKRIAKAAGVSKRIYPHAFRHTAATRDAAFLTDRELILKYGWAGDSGMPAVYSHMNPAQLEAKLTFIYSGEAR